MIKQFWIKLSQIQTCFSKNLEKKQGEIKKNVSVKSPSKPAKDNSFIPLQKNITLKKLTFSMYLRCNFCAKNVLTIDYETINIVIFLYYLLFMRNILFLGQFNIFKLCF